MSTSVNSNSPSKPISSNNPGSSNTKGSTNDPLTRVFQTVYFIESEPGAGYYGPIGIRPTITENSVKWEDTGHGQPSIPVDNDAIKVDGHPCSEFLKNPDYLPAEIVITKKNGKKVTFKLLDLSLYNSTVKYQVGNAPDFKSDDDLRRFYLNHQFLS